MLVRISHPSEITRRYFVTNGLDGALATLGLCLSFHASGAEDAQTVFRVSIGAAIALMMSGSFSAYVSESAERRREFRALQGAMVADLNVSVHARAARLIPWLVAAVNGLAPLIVSLIIILPLWLAIVGLTLPASPLKMSIGVAFVMVFLLGMFVGRVGGSFGVLSGLRTMLLAAATAGMILAIQ